MLFCFGYAYPWQDFLTLDRSAVSNMFKKQDKNGVAINGLYVVTMLSFIGPFAGANAIDTVTCFSPWHSSTLNFSL